MQIHELNPFQGTLGSEAFLVVDNGDDTGKISVERLTQPINDRIDDIITSPAPTEQEIIDARRGWNEVVYGSLGAAIRSQVKQILAQFYKFNTYDLLAVYGTPISRTRNGVTFTWDDAGQVCEVSGEAVGGDAYASIYTQTGAWQGIFERGVTYTIGYETTDPNVKLRIAVWEGVETTPDYYYFDENGHFGIPPEAAKIGVDLWVESGDSVSAVVKNVYMLRTYTAKEVTATIRDAMIGADRHMYNSLGDAIREQLNGKVDKVTGKVLSTNDFTNAEKTKLSGIEAGAEVNAIEAIKLDGTELTPDGNRAVNIPVDETLTLEHVPADAKATGDALAKIETVIDGMHEFYDLDFTGVETSGFGIANTGKWTSSSIAKSCVIPVSHINKISIKPNQDLGGYFALLKSYNPVSGEYVEFADGYTGRITYTEAEFVEYPTNGASYLFVLLMSSSRVDTTPTLKLSGFVVDETLSLEHIPADAKAVGEGFAELDCTKDLLTDYAFDFSGTLTSGFGIANTGKWTSSSIAKTCMIPLDNIAKIKITGLQEENSFIAFLKTYNPVSGEYADFSDEYPSRIVFGTGETLEFNVSGTMKYAVVYLRDGNNVDVTPQLEASSNKSLKMVFPTGDSSDRKYDINAALCFCGECMLQEGDFTVTNIIMPVGTTIRGNGGVTRLIMDSTASGSCIKMNRYCTIENLIIKGGDSSFYNSATRGTRCGIEWTGEDTESGAVSNCKIIYFDDSGISLHDTTQKTYRNLFISNCLIYGNYIGVDIRKNSEFNKITNCVIIANHIGFESRGGNNLCSNCGFDANYTGVIVDAAEGSNNGHGGFSNCTFHHSYHNDGYGIIVEDTGRMTFSGCHIAYSKIKLTNTNGNIFSGCELHSSAPIEIENGECNMFVGCIVRGWDSDNTTVTITNNTKTKIVNCFDRDGIGYGE